MSKIMMVHWKDMIEPDFLDKFISIMTEMVKFEKDPINVNKSTVSMLKKKFTDADVDNAYSYLRRLRFSGYEIPDWSDKIMKHHGWYGPYLDRKGELKFYTTADPQKTEYIKKDEFYKQVIEWEKQQGNDEMETMTLEEAIEKISEMFSYECTVVEETEDIEQLLEEEE